jgi:hypothetical protein
MDAPQEVTLNPQDIINTLVGQRNAAMDEIARQGSIILALQRKIEELTKEKPDAPNDPQ